MSAGFQVFVDARGDLHCANGQVVDVMTGATFEVGNPVTEPGVAGGLARWG